MSMSEKEKKKTHEKKKKKQPMNDRSERKITKMSALEYGRRAEGQVGAVLKE